MRKPNRMFWSGLLTLSLLLGILPAGAAAASRSMDNFVSTRTYTEQFTDVADGSWYHDNVAWLYELGLTDGITHTQFAPENSMTLAEAISFIGRVHSIYHTGSLGAFAAPYYDPSAPWYAYAVWYLQDSKILDDRFEGMYDQPATRGQIAYLLANALPSKECLAINRDTVSKGYASGQFIPDVTNATAYQEEILNLYRWGILAGSDEVGSFFPDDQISRSEFAAMLTRLVNPDYRIALRWDLSKTWSAKGTSYTDLVTGQSQYTPHHQPWDSAAVDGNIRYMLQHGQNTITLNYEPKELTRRYLEGLLDSYMDGISYYPEQSYLGVSYEYDETARQIQIQFDCPYYPPEQFDQIRDDTLNAAIAVHDEMWSKGTITGGMSEMERARVYYDWIIDHCVYDDTFSDASHTAYRLFTDGTAVCDGYTAAYNLLLKLEGIDCSSAFTNDHIWTTATLDGIFCHIDTTWGDEYHGSNYDYFAMTPQDSWNRFP